MHLYPQLAAVSDAGPMNALRYGYISIGQSGIITTSLSNDERLILLARSVGDFYSHYISPCSEYPAILISDPHAASIQRLESPFARGTERC